MSPRTPHGSCLICGYDKPWSVFAVAEAEVPVVGVCADCKRGADKFSEPPPERSTSMTALSQLQARIEKAWDEAILLIIYQWTIPDPDGPKLSHADLGLSIINETEHALERLEAKGLISGAQDGD